MENKLVGKVVCSPDSESSKDMFLKNKKAVIETLNVCDEFVIFARVKEYNCTQCVSSIQSVFSFNEIYQTMDTFIGVIREQIRKYGDVKNE